jgi:hypothetical protein
MDDEQVKGDHLDDHCDKTKSYGWRWKICDRCRYSGFWKRARYCDACPNELRLSDQPLERSHWVESWLYLALWLWLLQFLVLEMP